MVAGVRPHTEMIEVPRAMRDVARGKLRQHDQRVMRPALGHIDAVKPNLVGVASNADDHVGPGLKRSEPDAKTHAGNDETSA